MAVWLSPGFGFGFGFASAFAIVCTALVRGEEQWEHHIKGSQNTLCEGEGEQDREGATLELQQSGGHAPAFNRQLAARSFVNNYMPKG